MTITYQIDVDAAAADVVVDSWKWRQSTWNVPLRAIPRDRHPCRSDPLAHEPSHSHRPRDHVIRRRMQAARGMHSRAKTLGFDARARARTRSRAAPPCPIVTVVVGVVADGRRSVCEAAIVAVARARLYWRRRVREPRRADGGGGSRFRRCARIRALRATHVTARHDRSSALTRTRRDGVTRVNKATRRGACRRRHSMGSPRRRDRISMGHFRGSGTFTTISSLRERSRTPSESSGHSHLRALRVRARSRYANVLSAIFWRRLCRRRTDDITRYSMFVIHICLPCREYLWTDELARHCHFALSFSFRLPPADCFRPTRRPDTTDSRCVPRHTKVRGLRFRFS